MYPKRLVAYDGTPIIIVEHDNIEHTIKSFKAGLYGFDTESDYYHQYRLRLIQIYDGQNVYIFHAKDLIASKSSHFIKFFKAKDKIKIGVDIEGDMLKLSRFYENRYEHRIKREKNNLNLLAHNRFDFKWSGIQDLQSIAHITGEIGFSMDKLAYKYLDDFKGNPSCFGDYINPTEEQFTYAANDAIISYKLLAPMMLKKPTEVWNAFYQSLFMLNSYDDLYEYITHYIFSYKLYLELDKLCKRIATRYKPWKATEDIDIPTWQIKGRQTMRQEVARVMVTSYLTRQKLISVANPSGESWIGIEGCRMPNKNT